MSTITHNHLFQISHARQIFLDITNIEFNNDRISAILNMIELNLFRAYRSQNLHVLFYSNGLAIWHGFSDITHIKDNNDHKLPILNLIELKFLRA